MTRALRPWATLTVLAAALHVGSARADSPLAASAASAAHDLAAVPRAPLVVASPLVADVPAPRGDELAVRVASLVASALGPDARAWDHPLTLASSRVRASASRASALVYLDVRVASGELRITADLYAVIANGWDRLRTTPAPPTTHSYVHVPVDAEVRGYLAPVQLERARVTKFVHDAGPVLAVACGSLEGSDQLVLVSSREVLVGYLAEGRFVVAHRALAGTLGRRSPIPLREPLATAVVDSVHGTLSVGWGDRLGVTMTADLVPRAELAGFPVRFGGAVACAQSDPSRGGFSDALVACEDAHPLAEAASRRPTVVDAWAALDVAGQAQVIAAHDPSGTLHLTRTGGGDALVVSGIGAQLAVGDLDQDGEPEVITTSDQGEDALVVSSWRKGRLVPRLRWPAPAGVDAVAVCPPEANDAPSVVAAVGGEIWLVH